MVRFFLVLIALLVFLPACAPKTPPPQRTAEYYLKEGEIFFEKHRYADAITSWKKVRDSYYSPELNKIAEFKIAEAQYLSENFEEAAASYSAYLKEHPRDERVPDVLYYLGMSFYRQMLSMDRDQTATEKALQTFTRLQSDYPADKRAEDVALLVQRCRNRLAAHEVYVGRFYLRTDKYQAAVNRLTGMLEAYPQAESRDEALFYLGSAYLKLQQKEQGTATFDTLFEQFPQSPYLDKARKILKKNG
jgi:outer membrane protein assembly factor BamD